MSQFWKTQIDTATKIEVLVKTPLHGVPTLSHLKPGKKHKFTRSTKTGFKINGGKYTFSIREMIRQYDSGCIDVDVIES